MRSNADPLSGTKVLSAPRELMRLINWLMTHGLDAVEDLFVAEGDEAVMAQIREVIWGHVRQLISSPSSA